MSVSKDASKHLSAPPPQKSTTPTVSQASPPIKPVRGSSLPSDPLAASATPSALPEAPASPLLARVSTAFKQLTISAAKLNGVSNELSKPIMEIEAALKRLNLGIPTWVVFVDWHDPNTGAFWDREVGYAKVSGKWGIAIRANEGNYNDPESTVSEEWLFNDAARGFRVAAVDKLPELLERLIVSAEETAEKLSEKIEAARQVANAVNPTKQAGSWK
jgi:hypothetical protein